MLVNSRVSSADALLRLSGEEFVAACYRSILWRHPDQGGMAHYLTRVAMGEGKLAVAADIASSEEARRLSPAKKALAAEVLALHARKLISDAWTPPGRRKAAEQVFHYFAVISGSLLSGPGNGKTPDAKDVDPFSSYYTSVIEDRTR